LSLKHLPFDLDAELSETILEINDLREFDRSRLQPYAVAPSPLQHFKEQARERHTLLP
jgi:hypothetical protein